MQRTTRNKMVWTTRVFVPLVLALLMRDCITSVKAQTYPSTVTDGDREQPGGTIEVGGTENGNVSDGTSGVTLLPSDYVEFHVGNAINTYGPPVITMVGTVGNILSLVVVLQPTNRKSSANVYVGTLAFLDTIMLWLGLFQYWALFNFFPSFITEPQCHGMFFVVNFFSNWSVWVIVAMTTERLIVVVFPLRSAWLCSVKKAATIIGVLCGISAVKNLHYIWTADFAYNPATKAAQCAFGLLRRGSWVIALQWLDTCLSSIIPFLVILAINVMIITTIRRQKKAMQEMNSSSNSGHKERGTGKDGKGASQDTGITVMLVTVSLGFVITTCPLFLLRLAFTFIARDTPYRRAAYHLGHHICHKLWYTNNAINFYLYCLTGAKFRRDLAAVFRCGQVNAMSKSSSNTTLTASSELHK